jgi:two-component system chemotaxis response regulator CheY
MNILLVDDSGTMRTIQKRCLIAMGIPETSIMEARDGQMALDLFVAGRFTLVISDWNMPVMDGLALLKEIRSRDRNTPVIMVTTEAERERVVAAIQAGVSDYLVKPFSPEDLKKKLEKWMPAAV